jgi:hypothetical protein
MEQSNMCIPARRCAPPCPTKRTQATRVRANHQGSCVICVICVIASSETNPGEKAARQPIKILRHLRHLRHRVRGKRTQANGPRAKHQNCCVTFVIAMVGNDPMRTNHAPTTKESCVTCVTASQSSAQVSELAVSVSEFGAGFRARRERDRRSPAPAMCLCLRPRSGV